MARLQRTGVTFATPARDASELAGTLSKLVGQIVDDEAVLEIYSQLGFVTGRWLSEQEQLETEPVKKALLTTARTMSDAATLLSGHRQGFHQELATAVSSRVAAALANDPGISSRATVQDFLGSFVDEAGRVAHACLLAVEELPPGPGKGGRRAPEWHNAFTALLLWLAQQVGVQPTLRKDRITGERSGWLLDAAEELETFLYREMRAPSEEARGKRLERSLKRLRQAVRQNSPNR